MYYNADTGAEISDGMVCRFGRVPEREPMTGPVLVVRNWLGYAVLITDSAVDATVAARHHAGATITAAPAADSVEYRVAQYARRPFSN